MPLYEYECTACHKHTEKIQKFSDKEITDCPFCGGKLQRVISAPAIAFKGGGWFKDGYGSAKPSGTSDTDGGSASGDSAPADKPAAAPTADSSGSSTPATTVSPSPASASSTSDKK